jgi:hypothetical protein
MSFSVDRIDTDTVRVTSYSPSDSLDLPREILDALPSFDGQRSTIEALQAIAEEVGLELEEDLLSMLVDFEVLGAAR